MNHEQILVWITGLTLIFEADILNEGVNFSITELTFINGKLHNTSGMKRFLRMSRVRPYIKLLQKIGNHISQNGLIVLVRILEEFRYLSGCFS